MFNDDEMIAQLFMQEEANSTSERQQQLLMLANLLRLRQHLLAISVPRRGSSRVGKALNKDRHRQADALLLDSDYFADDATHTPKDFRRLFRINKNLFMKILFRVREYDTYFMCKQENIDRCINSFNILAT
jgi:hypothetical protein